MRQILASVPLALFLMAGAGFADSTTPSSRGEIGQKVDDFGLFDHNGKFHRLRYFHHDKQTRAVVLFIQGNGCPLVRKQIPELKKLQGAYGSKGVVFWLLNANSQDTRAEIASEAREFDLDLPVLKDETQLVAEALGLERTAEAIVIDSHSWRIAYRGPITDRLTYQAEKPQPGHEYLREALDAVIEGRPVADARVNAPGCKIALAHADPEAHRRISYSDTVAPLLIKRCAGCHTKGGIGSWAMSDHAELKGWGPMMLEVMLTRQMPPWQADPAVGHFANDFGLTPEESRTLVHWIQAGAPRGDGPDPLAAFRPERPPWKLGQPDHVIDIGEQAVPAEGVIEYRYVRMDAPFDHEVWLRAVEVNPGNTRVLHHVLAWAFDPAQEKPDQPAPRKSVAGYAPGMGPDQFPEGTGVLIKPGWKIEFQLHYTASGKAETDATRLGLYFAKEPPAKELRTGLVIDTKFKIPPGAREFTITRGNEMQRDILLFSMNPHMHFRGKAMSYSAHYPDGRVEPLLSVPLYHFNWQRSYRLAEPKFLPKGTRIEVTAAWDNSELNPSNPDPAREIGWGEQSWDEMFFASYQYVSADKKPQVAGATADAGPAPPAGNAPATP